MADKPKTLSRKLIELAHKLNYFFTPDRQPHAQLPGNRNVPLHSEEFYTWLATAADEDGLPISPAMLPAAIRKLDAETHGTATPTRQLHLRTAPLEKNTYRIDLQSWDCSALEVNRAGWKLSMPSENVFLWPDSNSPYPTPEPAKITLITTLERSFQLSADAAKTLATWLTAALLPDQPCPVLVITGQARDSAARLLRTLLDPVTHPLLVLPRLENQFHKLALTNRVLAFSIGNKLSEGRREALAKLSTGTDARLTQCSKRRDALQTYLRCPVLISAETAVEIAPQQIHVEINQATAFDPAQTFAALLSEVVKFLCTFNATEEDATEELLSAASITSSPECLLEEDPRDPPAP